MLNCLASPQSFDAKTGGKCDQEYKFVPNQHHLQPSRQDGKKQQQNYFDRSKSLSNLCNNYKLNEEKFKFAVSTKESLASNIYSSLPRSHTTSTSASEPYVDPNSPDSSLNTTQMISASEILLKSHSERNMQNRQQVYNLDASDHHARIRADPIINCFQQTDDRPTITFRTNVTDCRCCQCLSSPISNPISKSNTKCNKCKEETLFQC